MKEENFSPNKTSWINTVEDEVQQHGQDVVKRLSFSEEHRHRRRGVPQAFTFVFIYQGGAGLYPTLAFKATELVVLNCESLPAALAGVVTGYWSQRPHF